MSINLPFGRLALAASMAGARRRLLTPMLEASVQPCEAQQAVLRQILRKNAQTHFGLRHGFDRIDDPAAWRNAVPVQTFEDLRPWIEQQVATRQPCLTIEAPAMYNMTSGTTGAPKLIPITPSGLHRIKREQRLFACCLHRFDPKLFAGRILGIGSPAVEGRLENGAPYGSASGLIYREMPAAVRARYAVPPEVFEIADYDTRYRAIAIFGLSADDVTLATTANPSTFLRLLSVIDLHLDEILRDVADGTLSLETGLPRKVIDGLATGRRPRPEVARSLARQAAKQGGLTFKEIWPALRGLAVWTGGSCGVSLRALQPKLHPDVQIFEIGYTASEFRGTVNVEPGANLCLPMLLDVFFEFVESESWEVSKPTYLGLDEIEEGRQYRVVITTNDGLYRYDMNDVVQVCGRSAKTPALKFVQKGRGITNITGEKLHESQVGEALALICASADLHPLFYLALADEEAAKYRVYVEAEGSAAVDEQTLSRGLDDAISARNMEYRSKRASGRLGDLVLMRLRSGASEAYRRHCIEAGQRDSQFKVMPLRYAREVDFDLARWVADS